MQVIWKLKEGNHVGQETADQKRLAAGEYIEKLTSKGYDVSFEDKGKYLIISYEPSRNTRKRG